MYMQYGVLQSDGQVDVKLIDHYVRKHLDQNVNRYRAIDCVIQFHCSLGTLCTYSPPVFAIHQYLLVFAVVHVHVH